MARTILGPAGKLLILLGCTQPAWGQEWEVPYRTRAIQVDGFVDEWDGVPKLVLTPGAPGIRVSGRFAETDLDVTVQALWDEQSLYLAVSWFDNVWDIQQVRRSEAVFVTSDKQRRDRMLFFDNFKFEIRELKYDYLLWFSPRVKSQGPFYWQRRREGVSNMEGAVAPPVITPRQADDRVTLELLFSWAELRLKSEKVIKEGLPIELAVADSDTPGYLEDSKTSQLKWLDWAGRMVLGKKTN